MNTFVENNKKFLKFYCTVLRISGWILMMVGLCSVAINVLLARFFPPELVGVVTLNMPIGFFEFILFGLLGLGIASLIRYLLDDCKPGFILRHGGTFLYAYVIFILIVTALRSVWAISYWIDPEIKYGQSLLAITSITSIVLFAAKALVLIGVAQFLKRIMHVIEEQKTLV